MSSCQPCPVGQAPVKSSEAMPGYDACKLCEGNTYMPAGSTRWVGGVVEGHQQRRQQ